MPGGVVVAQRTLTPSTQVRILAGQPSINNGKTYNESNFSNHMLNKYFLYPGICRIIQRLFKKMGIFLVNILVGWTGIGWIIALIWEFISESTEEKSLRLNSYKD